MADGIWTLSPWGLAGGRLNADLNLLVEGGAISGQMSAPFGGERLSLMNVKGRVPLSRLQQHLTMIPVPLRGDLSLKLDELLITAKGRPERAEGRVVWHGAGVQMNEVIPLGDLQMSLKNSEGGEILGTISDSGGPLQLSATLSLQPDGTYSLSGNVTPNESTPESLSSMLPMLGKPDSQGSYPLNLSGRI